ncbi:MAG: T9SS type A sorting domain-containing protein [Ignavibacteriales bacterium]|nr:T9SS type A sorting domain-containing protein [Ignavibacteriales bacterium]
MLKKNLVLTFLMGLSCLSAQTLNKTFHNISINPKASIQAQQDINILAVMVEFQPDDFELTYGDGTFESIYSKDYGNEIIDPLPHDANYFESHLEFAVNYYKKVSDNNVNITYTVLPNILTVSNPMREYSPLSGESFEPLADFSKEVWGLANSQYSTQDFSQYNLFIIFHAGVGKDISTSNLFGEARDLPSIYLGQRTFKQFYGESFTGFQMNDGTLINNSVILPETESREESGIGGTALIELSINGLLVSSIASHLGLPDLFDAETGKSAIGRFGLMDGQSLFAYAGLFPPEPSAWEKIFLGWEEPVVFEFDRPNINIVAHLAYALNQDHYKIVKIPINSTEYYLIENRARDVNKDGATITYKVNGQTRIINFAEDLDNFNNAYVDTLRGVIIDVDEFDWAVPGNGILVWHIDEKIINEGLSENRINVGENRGVDLEEADGIQDIGEEFQTIFGDIIIAEGDEFDFWYSSNNSKLYKNKFGSDTKPNTNSNNGANSLITLSNFSDIANEMSLSLSFGSENINLISRMENIGGPGSFLKLANNDPLKSFNVFESGLTINMASLLIPNFSDVEFALAENDNGELVVGAKDSLLNLIYFGNENIFNSIELGSKCTSPIVIDRLNENELMIYAGLENGEIKKVSYNLNSNESPILEETISVFNSSINQIALLNNEIISVSNSKIKFLDGIEINLQAEVVNLILTKNKSDEFIASVLTSDNSIYSYKKGDQNAELIYSSNSNIDAIALGDLNKMGENYIIFNEGNQIQVINFIGSIVDNFPFQINEMTNFVGQPNIADIDNDDFADIISMTDNGNIYAVSGKDGKILNGFPISIGGDIPQNNTIVSRDGDLIFSATSSNYETYFWNFNTTGDIQWGSKYGNNLNSSSVSSASGENFISTYFPKNKTYNWPNPVYGTETNFRTYVSEDSEVKVKIFDLAGDLVDEFKFSAIGGIDNEKSWDVSEIQSGAYFAHVEVKSNSGKTESKIIKIAVIK